MAELDLPDPKVFFTALGVLCAVLVSMGLHRRLHSALVFCWACFVKPVAGKVRAKPSEQQQQHALETFYKNQAHVYDSTREVLLKGRQECLQLCLAQTARKSDLVWIDIGGGTGRNVEYMDQLLPMTNFKAVYVVDLSPLLCDVARGRFERKGWGNVHVLLADACSFEVDGGLKADIVTFSYSLSMIPTFNGAIDHAQSIMTPGGVIGCVDFGIQLSDTSMGRANTVGGTLNRNIPWLLRNFWRIWFEADKVFLDLARRNYLEYKFGTVKALNAFNAKLGWIPYYVWVGVDKHQSPALLQRLNCWATESPYLAPEDSNSVLAQEVGPMSKGHEAALANLSKKLPYPSFYYQREAWRVYYDDESPQYSQFNNDYIYAFTWEDPREDHRILSFKETDTVLAITSAGDNILSYASLPTAPRRIHAVDLNPAQNHLLELKLAAFRTLTQKQIWQMFGEGRIASFKDILLSKLSPHMSLNAVQFWYNRGERTFLGRGLYDTGFTRWGLRCARWVFALFGVSKQVEELCKTTSVEAQVRLWNERIKPSLFNPFVATLLVGNPLFLWKALGVPANQAAMMGNSVFKYVVNTLDPVVRRSLILRDNYFYYLCLTGKYDPNNCPDYLTAKGYLALTTKSAQTGECPLDRLRLHTDCLNDVFARLAHGSIDIAIIMDHMDWFAPGGPDVPTEIRAVSQCLTVGGRVMLRSAAQHPWYIKEFEKLGFKCKPAAIRHSGESIDRVNMYASTWVCTKERDAECRRMSSLQI